MRLCCFQGALKIKLYLLLLDWCLFFSIKLWFFFHVCMFPSSMICSKALCGICQSCSEQSTSKKTYVLQALRKLCLMQSALTPPGRAFTPKFQCDLLILLHALLTLSLWSKSAILPALELFRRWATLTCPEMPARLWLSILSWLLCLRSGRKRKLVNSVRPAVSPEKIRGWSGKKPFPANSWYRVHSVGHSPGYLCCLAPLPLFLSMLPPPCHCQGAKNFLRRGNMEGRRKLSGISPVSSCASFPPRCVAHFSKRIRFLVKRLSSAVGVQ